MNAFYEIMQGSANFEELSDNIKKNNTPINVTGVSDSVMAHLSFCLAKNFDVPLLLVAPDERQAKLLTEDMKFFFKDEKFSAIYYPPSELMFYDVDVKSHDILGQRLKVLSRLSVSPKTTCVITTPDALCSTTLKKDKYEKSITAISVGDICDMESLATSLIRLGYKREDMVEGAGQFSIRGGILDFFSYNNKHPYRIEFFDDEIDSIRTFDYLSQRTLDRLNEVVITPAAELCLDEKERKRLIEKLDKILSSESVASHPNSDKLSNTLRRDIERLKQNISFPSIDKYIPLIYREKPTIMDYLSENTHIIWCDGNRIHERCASEEKRRMDDITELCERGILPEADSEYILSIKKALRRLTKQKFIALSGISHAGRDYKVKHTTAFSVKSLPGFRGQLKFFYESLDYYKKSGYKIIILAGSTARAENLSHQLPNEGFECSLKQNADFSLQSGGICILPGSIEHGFELPMVQTVIISDKEIFGNDKKRRKRREKINGEKIDNFSDLNIGDYVVHRNHGIGKYIGIERLSVDGTAQDYLKICYRGDDYLYVPTNQLDLVYKHIGRDGAKLKLNKLGGTEWLSTKQRVKAAAKDMAQELIDLYAKRSKIQGVAFPKDDEWQSDFEARFPYDETDDQLRSIEEVKQDMESPHPMDRLLCGDVGYGKTEVALRAAFKAVNAGYQVAYLVPTMILASQHYNTFKQRMKDYPINVALLSRFCTAAEEKRVKEGLKTGEIDVVIGTHKLFNKSISYKKLGLLVIDEEQRFGVAHKEKIKEMRKEVDVLTLSATPIPRTLHMSLTGIRDMSVINEPPSERYPVSTYVLEYDEDVISDAINKEIGRGGQVYYLYNRVDGIYKVANKIASLVPGIRVAVAHGKMNETELEDIMIEVTEGRVDVLVCTTIIETGLDIPNVNTIIIENSDMLGLAQLYQLRGRVGRSNRMAYAYLTYRKNKSLTPEAEKRLLAIKEFTEFGSGFKIAMRDLEIRGTGNLIGTQQHGHMDAVGYEMYCRLLEEAAAEIKGEEVKKETETRVDIPVSAFIPENYIENHAQRLAAYKRIASINSQDDLYDTYDEILDRYGTIPWQTENLMEIALIKAYATKYGISDVIGGDEMVVLKFDKENLPNMEPCIKLIESRPYGEIKAVNSSSPKLQIKLKKAKDDFRGSKYLKEIKTIVEALANFE